MFLVWVLASVEKGVTNMRYEAKDIVRGKVCNIVTNANKNFRKLRDQSSSQFINVKRKYNYL